MEKIYPSLIHRIGKRLFGDKPSPIGEVLPVFSEEIPRYPPFMKGLPTASVERILDTQLELIKAIEQALALPDDLYHTIAAPVIARYAAFSHLLPASESHHHRGAGGLFRHGLEVAHWATQASQGCLFATQASPRERKSQELRWRLAVCFAGLLHDIGKPVADMAVIDGLGQHTWNPCDENLTDWAEHHGIDRYFLRWRENRHKRHEQFSALVIERVLTRESRSYILAPGPDIMQAMLETIHGLDRGSKLYALVMSADCKSVERDLKAHYHSIDSAMGMPVEKYLFDAMRRLIKSGQWTINEKGARIWRFKEGLHIVWRIGAQDIVSTLAKDKVPGIPRDEDTLADILIERGLAIPKSLPDGRQYRYWRMQPEGLDTTLYMLRLTSMELIFSNEPPVIVSGIEFDEQTEVNVETTAKASVKSQQLSLQVSSFAVNDDAQGVKDQAMDVDSAEQPNGKPNVIGDISSVQPELPHGKLQSDTDIELLNTNPQQDNKPASPPLTIKSEARKIKASDQSSNQVKSDKPKPTYSQPSNIETPAESAKCWLNKNGLAGEWLLHIITAVNQAQWQWGVDVLELQDHYLLPFPGTPEKLNVESNLFIKTLEEKGWLVIDVLSPMRKVQIFHQVRGVLLAAEPSAVIRQLLTVARQVQNIDQSNTQSTPTTDNIKAPRLSTVNDHHNPKTPKIPKASDNQSPPIKTELPGTVSNKNAVEYPTSKNTGEGLPNTANPTQSVTRQRQATEQSTPVIVNKHGIDGPSQNQAIDTLINHVRHLRTDATEKSDDNEWHLLSNAELEQFLEQNPSIKRTRLMLDIANHPDCRSVGVGKGIQVRVRL